MRIYNRTQNRWVGEVKPAWSFFPRLKGLLFSQAGQKGLWLKPCSSVHTIGMKYALDILFLDPGLTVLKMELNVPPAKPLVSCVRSESVMEFFTGKWDSSCVKAGDQLETRE